MKKTMTKKKKLGLTPAANSCSALSAYNSRSSKELLPSLHVLDGESSQRQSKLVVPMEPSLTTTDGEFKLKYPSSLPNLDAVKARNIKTPSINELSKPRENAKKEYNLEYSELKGMLIKNMDDKVYYSGNTFYKSVASHSKFFQETLKENRDSRIKLSTRATSRNDRPYTSSRSDFTTDPSVCNFRTGLSSAVDSQSNFRSVPGKKSAEVVERDEIFNEIERFESRMPIARPGAYGKVDMQEAIKSLTNLQGKS